ncbi:type II secretion system protein [Candidatus Dojkabacteria bacterium]|uniref:Type II secretion system protein n=1 Tax=Candidatus Dojkabacteria bacterium TaxID=2099670 RepID=A0A847VCW5_9BACT|nr:type II secretion system protein [Candidatus Dojkabacteria bacterium]
MKKRVKYNGFSLVEMLFTIMLIGIISLLVGVTLNTIIKASNSTNMKNLARKDIDYIMELIKKTVSNSQLDYILLFDSGERRLSISGDVVTVTDVADMEGIYGDIEKVDGMVGNELHVKIYGYDTWSCIGYFKDKDNEEYGYLVQRIVRGELDDHGTCFSSSLSDTTFLHSLIMDIPSFEMSYIDVGDDKNSMFEIDMTIEPLFWPLKQHILVKPSVQRKAIISTEALTWY